MTEAAVVRQCAKCAKKLRANCAGDTCWSCRAKARKPRGSRVAAGPPPAPPALKPVKVKGDAVSRFKTVAAALGFDGTGMLEEYAQAWLNVLRSKAESMASSATTGLATLSKPPLTSVSLRPRRALDTGPAAIGEGAGA